MAYSTDMIGLFIERVNRQEKSDADWTNLNNLEQMKCEGKRTKLSVYRLL